MKPFSMESILRYRVQLEKQAQQKLFANLQQEAEIKQQVEGLENELSGLYAELAHEQQQGITVESLLIIENWISNRQESLKQARIQLNNLSQKILQIREELIKRSQDKKALAKLKKKQNTAFRHHLEKKEIAMFDEIAVLRHNR